LVTVENVEVVKLVYVQHEYRDTLIQVGMVVALLFVLLIVCVCVYIQKQVEFNDKVRKIVHDKDTTNERVAINQTIAIQVVTSKPAAKPNIFIEMEGVEENEILKSMHMYFEEQKKNLDTYPSLVHDSELYGTIDDHRKPAGPIAYGFVAPEKAAGRATVRLPGISG